MIRACAWSTACACVLLFNIVYDFLLKLFMFYINLSHRYFINHYLLYLPLKFLSMEHYYQFCINVQSLSNLSTMYPLYSTTVLLPEIVPFDSLHILKTAIGTRFVNGCLKFSNLSNTRVQYVATCCRIGSERRVCFFYQRPNIPLL